MLKKIISLLTIIALVFFTSSVFATNETKDSMTKAGNTVRNVVGGAENVVEDAAGAIGTGVKDIGNAVRDGAEGFTNTFNNNDARTYNATRTTTRRAGESTTTGSFLGMSANTWTWLVLAIAAIAIVGLVWYYAMQNKNEYSNHH